MNKLTRLIRPSPKINPDAITITVVFPCGLCRIYKKCSKPPIALGKENEGVVYIPIATAIPLGMNELQR